MFNSIMDVGGRKVQTSCDGIRPLESETRASHIIHGREESGEVVLVHHHRRDHFRVERAPVAECALGIEHTRDRLI